jgi:hypothetical protein
LILANLENNYIDRGSKQLKLKFTPQTGNESATSSAGSKNVELHEGYWYEGVLIFREDGSKGTTVLCSGETYIRFAVVPEYATWNPTANNKMSAAWNNDANWRRSVRNELYKKENQYTDYQGGGYVPMKFTKVTIPNLSGLYFPSLGYIAYQKSTGIATRLNNAKGDAATANIQYDMLAKWDANTESHGLNADGNLECEPFYGNTCDQIYFKPGGELLNQCYLIYNKAWVEKEMKPNTWYALTSPLQDTYAGDIFHACCAASLRQEVSAVFVWLHLDFFAILYLLILSGGSIIEIERRRETIDAFYLQLYGRSPYYSQRQPIHIRQGIQRHSLIACHRINHRNFLQLGIIEQLGILGIIIIFRS